jgi:hypothetical protein
VTHEYEPNDETTGGPQHDDRLPDAYLIPVGDGPDDVDPLTDPDDWDG